MVPCRHFVTVATPLKLAGGIVELSLDLESDRYQTVVLVCGGVGVAAHLPLAHALCRDAQAGRPLTRLHVVWACSDAAMLHALLPQTTPQLQLGGGHHMEFVSSHTCVIFNT